MVKQQDRSSPPVWVAIDVAKRCNEVLIEHPQRACRRRLSVVNTRQAHDRLIAHLQAFERPVTIGFEATGNYHRPLIWRLLTAGFNVQLISSVSLARTREALHNSWDKNDPKDAQVMLYMMKLGHTQRYYDPLHQGINDWQELSKTHEVISRAKTDALHRLQTHYLPLYFPEVDRFRHTSRAEWFFIFLDRFPVPAAITVLDKELFIRSAWDLVGRKVAKRRVLNDLYETARESIALPIDPDSPAVSMYRMVIAHIRQLIQQRDAIEQQAHALLCEHPDYQRLRQLPRYRSDHRLDDPGGSWRLAPLSTSPAVPQVLWPGPGNASVRSVTRANRSCPSTAMPACDGPSGWRDRLRFDKGENTFRGQVHALYGKQP